MMKNKYHKAFVVLSILLTILPLTDLDSQKFVIGYDVSPFFNDEQGHPVFFPIWWYDDNTKPKLNLFFEVNKKSYSTRFRIGYYHKDFSHLIGDGILPGQSPHLMENGEVVENGYFFGFGITKLLWSKKGMEFYGGAESSIYYKKLNGYETGNNLITETEVWTNIGILQGIVGVEIKLSGPYSIALESALTINSYKQETKSNIFYQGDNTGGQNGNNFDIVIRINTLASLMFLYKF